MTEPLMTAEERLNPVHSAVLVIDMQNDFCAEGGYVEAVVGRSTAACRDLVPRLQRFLDGSRELGVPIVWVRAIYDHDKIPLPMLAKQRQKGANICCGSGSEGADFYGVAPQGEEPVFDKHNYSAFIGAEPARWLRDNAINSLVFTGVQTNVCVETSLRDAVCQGFYSTIAADCVASHAPALHDATLANVGALFGDVMQGEDILAIWRRNGRSGA